MTQVINSNFQKSENYVFTEEISLLITGMSFHRKFSIYFLFIFFLFIYLLMIIYIESVYIVIWYNNDHKPNLCICMPKI